MNNIDSLQNSTSRPPWLRRKISFDQDFINTQEIISRSGLNSVCEEAVCPNRGECWSNGHVTFMILGRTCSRNCTFCNVKNGSPEIVDEEEPVKIARAVKKMGIKFLVITSVTRDDLEDKGAGQFVETVGQIKKYSPSTLTEILIPDFRGEDELIREVVLSGADIVGHNIEMPELLYPNVRPEGDYQLSLHVISKLAEAKKQGIPLLVKSAMMLGMGEGIDDIFRTMKDLYAAGVDIFYAGQYLSPSAHHRPVSKYYHPEEFDNIKNKADEIGFPASCSGPLVRSSYKAYESYMQCRLSS